MSSVWLDPLLALAAVGSATGIAMLARPHVAEADLVLIYLVAVALASLRLHRVSAFLTAILAVIAFNFFFVPPVRSFAVADLRYWLTFAVMTVAGIVVSSSATRMRDRARRERERTQHMEVLLEALRGLTSASTLERIGELGERSLVALSGARVALELGDKRFGDLTLLERQDARRLGGAVLAPGPWEQSAAAREVVRAATALLGAAVERLLLDEEARAARLAAEVEQSRSDLLSAVSHDLRTPLGTIKGAATALQNSWSQLDQGRRAQLLDDIDVEADRLGRMLANLLDITRLQGRDVGLTGDWHAPEDVVGSAIRAARALVGSRDVRARLPESVSLVWMDPLLVEQALVNLLDNAARHGGHGPIDVTVETDAKGATFSVADRGPGFGPGDPQRWFQRFERGDASVGTGLGLAICRAVVELHGGTITATDRTSGGACVRFSVPLGGPRGEQPPTWEGAEAAHG